MGPSVGSSDAFDTKSEGEGPGGIFEGSMA
jgi:hypothetical protein